MDASFIIQHPHSSDVDDAYARTGVLFSRPHGGTIFFFLLKQSCIHSSSCRRRGEKGATIQIQRNGKDKMSAVRIRFEIQMWGPIPSLLVDCLRKER